MLQELIEQMVLTIYKKINFVQDGEKTKQMKQLMMLLEIDFNPCCQQIRKKAARPQKHASTSI